MGKWCLLELEVKKKENAFSLVLFNLRLGDNLLTKVVNGDKTKPLGEYESECLFL